MDITIWHNPRCSKSRITLQMLRDRGVEPTILEYLKTPPSADDIRAVAARLGVEPKAMMRTKEAVFRELDLGAADDGALVGAMADHPILIERPVVIAGDQAVLGRPPENIDRLFLTP